MAHGQPSAPEIRLDRPGQSEESKAIGNRAPVASHALAELLLRPREVGEKPLEGLRLLHRVQIFSEEILDERELERLGIGGFADDGRNVRQPRHPRGPPATLADYQLIFLSDSSNDDWLENPGSSERF